MAQKKIEAAPSKLQLPLHKKNYVLMLIGIGIVILGYILMSGGGSADPNVFSEDIFSFRRITLAPIVVLGGYVFIGYAIMYRPKQESDKTEAEK